MVRRMNVAWVAAVGAGLLMLAAQVYGAAAQAQTTTQKASTTQKPAAQKTAPAPKVPMTTLTGCLKVDGSHFELTNVEGSQAEKGRNWKTGFVTKSTKNIQVVGASAAVRLRDQVGSKVTVVGTKDGEMHLKATSVKRVAASCT
jgi:hypothetical protein